MKRLFSISVMIGAIVLTHSSSAVIDAASATSAVDSNTPSGDRIIARGKGFEVRRRAMDQVLANAKVGNPQDQLPSDAEPRVLAHLIEIQLVLQKATDAEKAEARQKNDVNFTNIVKTMGAEFERQLKATGMTADDLRGMLFDEEAAQTSLTRQLGIKVTDGDAKKYFNANPGAFDEPEKVRIRELLLYTTEGYTSKPLPDLEIQARHKKIFELYQRVRGGEDFAALARQYNEDLISKGTGEVSLRADQMEYADLAFSMKPGQISGVITNEEGYLFFQLLEKIPARKNEFPTLADRLKRMLAGQEKRRLAPDYIKGLWKEADVEILDPGLKAAMAAGGVRDAEPAEAREKEK